MYESLKQKNANTPINLLGVARYFALGNYTQISGHNLRYTKMLNVNKRIYHTA